MFGLQRPVTMPSYGILNTFSWRLRSAVGGHKREPLPERDGPAAVRVRLLPRPDRQRDGGGAGDGR